MYLDLNVSVQRSAGEVKRVRVLHELFRLGYDVVALNTTVHGRLMPKHALQGPPAPLPLPPSTALFRDPSLLRPRGWGPPTLGLFTAERWDVRDTEQPQQEGPEQATQGTSDKGKSKGKRKADSQAGSQVSSSSVAYGPCQLTRITAVLETLEEAQLLTASSQVLSSYDLVAARPTSGRAFSYLCSADAAAVDIIQLDLAQRLPFHLTKKNTDAALKRGVSFELCYSPAIKSANTRRHLIGGARALLAVTRGRGLILSSGADGALYTRSPGDVMNLGQLLGLTQEQAGRCLTRNAMAVLKRAERRKGGHGWGGGEGGGEGEGGQGRLAIAAANTPQELQSGAPGGDGGWRGSARAKADMLALLTLPRGGGEEEVEEESLPSARAIPVSSTPRPQKRARTSKAGDDDDGDEEGSDKAGGGNEGKEMSDSSSSDSDGGFVALG